MSHFNLSDIDRNQFTDEISKMCFAILHCRAELLNDGNGFSVISSDGPANISNIEWEGGGPTNKLTDAEVQAKVVELFP